MPDSRSHRGPDPSDARLFAPGQLPRLREAAHDVGWLRGRGYTADASLKLVGDRHQLERRQRQAIARAACSDQLACQRRAAMCRLSDAGDAELSIDGFNVLTTLEVALSGGVVLVCRDGCCRDIAGVHGSYRAVEETLPALGLLARVTGACAITRWHFYLDEPVSNSGRLSQRIRQLAAQQKLPWQVSVVRDADAPLLETSSLVASSDGYVLDHCHRWVNLAREIITTHIPGAFLVDLSGNCSES